ncbi:MAG: hypothetical protein ACREX8_03545 [Gammaproteobacteria bacterium]
MTEWSFEIRLSATPSDEVIDSLFEAGLDDCSIAGDLLYCNREAPSLLAAVASVSADVRKVTGLRPVAVEADDPVTLGDAAQRLRGLRSAESLRLLAEGKRGPGGFPAPLVDTGHLRVFSWAEISTWLRTRMGDDVPEVDPDLMLADAALRLLDRAERVDAEHVAAVRQLVGC